MSSNVKIAEALDDLQDARAELLRYRRMLGAFGAGTAGGVALIIVGGVVSTLGLSDLAVALCIPGGLFALLCAFGFGCRLFTAYERPSYSESAGAKHPALKVRRAERAYNRALAESSSK